MRAHRRPVASRPLAVALATAGGVGYVPVAPGTCGAALAIPIFVLLSPVGTGLLALSWAALLFLGAWAAEAAEQVFGREDDGRIVIDEVVGQLLTFAPLLFAGRPHSAVLLVTGFVVFRVFDIWKPRPVRWAERRFQGGFGVMMDDVVAGALGAVVVAALLSIARFRGASHGVWLEPGFGIGGWLGGLPA